MNTELLEKYKIIRNGGTGYFKSGRGLIEVSGKEAVQFLNGLITNDVARLEEGEQMSAAFPNAQGRLLALVKVKRRNEKFLFETEAATHEKVFQNLFRFTFAGDFFVEDLSENYENFEIQGTLFNAQNSENIEFQTNYGSTYFVPKDGVENFTNDLIERKAIEITEELHEIFRIENGIPKYGAEWDETTIVPELGIENLISYNKGCYIGQEIIARIYFRGHVAKQLKGLIFEDEAAQVASNDEIKSPEGKNAGKVTSVTFSPKLNKIIALAFVRYDYLAEGTGLMINDCAARVKNLPFV
jgi:folate-binding protein YgfZ